MKFEYKVVAESYSENMSPNILARTLNGAGKEGWELVSVLGPIQEMQNQGPSFLFFFKRVAGE